jgi:hypothetical protein
MSESKTFLSDEDRKKELEAELERHKMRFLAASRKGMEAFKSDVSILNWVGTYPVEAAVLAFLGGLWLGSSKALDRAKVSSLV